LDPNYQEQQHVVKLETERKLYAVLLKTKNTAHTKQQVYVQQLEANQQVYVQQLEAKEQEQVQQLEAKEQVYEAQIKKGCADHKTALEEQEQLHNVQLVKEREYCAVLLDDKNVKLEAKEQEHNVQLEKERADHKVS
jgi:hypothetical protein